MQGFGMGRYRPPDADPTQQSFNQGRHPLGVRARKLDQGILIVRFELPFNVWCAGCNNHIGQGVRYNAEKSHVGDYYSTKIWAFRCKCHLCSSWFEIRTDPKNARYVIHEGARQQHQDWDPEENGGHPIYDDSSAKDKPVDAFSQLEKRESDRDKAIRLTERVLELEEHNEARWSDPYTLNAKLRDTFRKEKRVRTAKIIRDLELKKRIGWREDAVLVNDDDNDANKADGARQQQQQQARKGDGQTASATATSSQRWKSEQLAMQEQKLKSGQAALEYQRLTSTGLSLAKRSDGRSSSATAPSSGKTRSSTSSSKLGASHAKRSAAKPPPSSQPASGSGRAKSTAVEKLRQKLIANTRKKQDPFLQQIQHHAARR
ncbi:Protein saf4 [Thecaphora frezii]